MLTRLLTALVVMTGGAWFGLELIERYAIYPFDSTRVSPADLGLTHVTEREFDTGERTLVVWTAPPDPGQPVIFYLHGNAGNLASRAGRFRHFLDRGYGLVAPAYPGSSGSTGAPSQNVIETDIATVWRALPDLAPTAPMILYGESLGTAAAIHLVAKANAAPTAVILEAPFTRMADVIVHSYPQIAPLIPQLTNRWDSLSHAQALTMPLLILHGTEDTLIPPAQGRALYAAAPARYKRFAQISGAGHTDLWRSSTLPLIWQVIDRQTR